MALKWLEQILVERLRRYTLSAALIRMDPEHADEIPHKFAEWRATTTFDFNDAIGYAQLVYNMKQEWPWSDDKGAS